MTVTVNVFARLREQLGTSAWTESVPEGTTSRQLVKVLSEREAAISELENVLRVAVNDEWVQKDRILEDGDEVALLTPVSGG
ncbi:MAG: molybdopterin converting factor subunit 1 [Rhodothermales bacterium]